MKLQTIAAAILLGVSGAASALVITPIATDFNGMAPGLTYGGSGIAAAGPNAVTSFTSLASDSLVFLAMSATPRVSGMYIGPAVTAANGVYTVTPDASPPGGSNNAGWNFNFAVIGDTRGLMFEFYADGAAGAASDVPEQLLFSAAFTAAAGSAQSTQGSQNLGFNFLGFDSFDPLATGEYTFGIRALQVGTDIEVGSVGIQVSAVPEPSAYLMALAGLGLLAGVTRRRTKKA